VSKTRRSMTQKRFYNRSDNHYYVVNNKRHCYLQRDGSAPLLRNRAPDYERRRRRSNAATPSPRAAIEAGSGTAAY